MARRSKANDSKRLKKSEQDSFLEAYSQCGNLTYAAELSDMTRGRHYYWLANDPDYRPRFEEAQEKAIDSLEKEARRRAVEGVEEPVGWYQGEAGGVVRKYSDTLLIFLLKGARPEKYRERVDHRVTAKVEHRGVLTVPAETPVDQWQNLLPTTTETPKVQ